MHYFESPCNFSIMLIVANGLGAPFFSIETDLFEIENTINIHVIISQIPILKVYL